MSAGQSINLKGMTFNSGPRFFSSTHYLTTDCSTKRMPFDIDFGCKFISTPAFFGGGSVVNDSGTIVNLTIDTDMVILKDSGFFIRAQGFINATADATLEIGTFDTTVCLVFIANGTY